MSARPGSPSRRNSLLVKDFTPDTPSRHKSMHSERADADLKSARKANLDDIGPDVDQIPLKKFFSTYLPSVSSALRCTKIMAYLKVSKAFTGGQWTHFNEKPKGRKRVHEDVCYAHVQTVVEAIVQAGKVSLKDSTPLTIRCNPNRTPKAKLRTSTCRPDCYILLRPPTKGSESWWEDIAVSGEFKKDNDNTDDTNSNTEQLTWDMNQTMRNDPLRRFTFGFTIENTTMRIWYCDRSEVVVSQEFDFFADVVSVIYFFTSVMFAQPDELGWDPTMTRVPDTDQYDIIVRTEDDKETTYRTCGLICAAGAEALRGRATRVWKCMQLDAKGRIVDGPFALKDTWIDADREREGTKIEILRDLGTPQHRTRLQDNLLSVKTHGDVYIDGQADSTHNPRQRSISDYERFAMEKEKPTAELHRMVVHQSRAQISTPVGGPGKVPEAIPQYHRKVHYRIVYGEVGVPLHTITDLGTVFGALVVIMKVLRALHLHGWVHRDVSTSNILMVGDQPKLGDLEYAKRCDDIEKHDIRTANVLFTPVEIALRRLLFQRENSPAQMPPIALNIPEDSLDLPESYVVNEAQDATGLNSTLPSGFVLRYNPLHDHESLWWIAVYFVVNREVVQVEGKDPVSRLPGCERAQKRLANTLFSHPDSRHSALREPLLLRNEMECLHPSVGGVKDELLHMRQILYNAFCNAEDNLAETDWLALVSVETYMKLQQCFVNAAKFSAQSRIQVRRYDAPTSDSTEVVGSSTSSGATSRRGRKAAKLTHPTGN